MQLSCSLHRTITFSHHIWSSIPEWPCGKWGPSLFLSSLYVATLRVPQERSGFAEDFLPVQGLLSVVNWMGFLVFSNHPLWTCLSDNSTKFNTLPSKDLQLHQQVSSKALLRWPRREICHVEITCTQSTQFMTTLRELHYCNQVDWMDLLASTSPTQTRPCKSQCCHWHKRSSLSSKTGPALLSAPPFIRYLFCGT